MDRRHQRRVVLRKPLLEEGAVRPVPVGGTHQDLGSVLLQAGTSRLAFTDGTDVLADQLPRTPERGIEIDHLFDRERHVRSQGRPVRREFARVIGQLADDHRSGGRRSFGLGGGLGLRRSLRLGGGLGLSRGLGLGRGLGSLAGRVATRRRDQGECQQDRRHSPGRNSSSHLLSSSFVVACVVPAGTANGPVQIRYPSLSISMVTSEASLISDASPRLSTITRSATSSALVAFCSARMMLTSRVS